MNSENMKNSLSLSEGSNKNRIEICPNCKNALPYDSVFCQICGVKIQGDVACEVFSNNSTNGIGDELLFEEKIGAIKGDTPVIVESVHLFCSPDREKFFLRCRFRSLSNRAIAALMVDVLCFDVWGNQLPTVFDAQILDLNTKRDEVFGYEQKIVIIDSTTRSVKIKLKKIRYVDGTISECLGNEMPLPKEIPIAEHFSSDEVTQQYIYQVSKKAKVVPSDIGDYWMCSCKRINANSENVCTYCGADKQIVFDALDKNFLYNIYPDYVAAKRKRDDEERQECERVRAAQIQHDRDIAIQRRMAVVEAKEKHRKTIKRIVIISSIIIAVAFIVFSIIKENKYSTYCDEARNFAVGEMHEDFTNVYAYVIAVRPKYTVSSPAGYIPIEQLFCKCTTVEGKELWITISSYEYADLVAKSGTQWFGYTDLYFNEPVKVHGYMTTFADEIDNPPTGMNDTLVLYVKDVD